MGLLDSFFGKKPPKTCVCICLVPERFCRDLDKQKLDKVLRAYASLTALPVVRRFHLESPEAKRIRYHPDSNPPSVTFAWTIPEDIEKDVIRMTRECWQKITEINDQEGLEGMLAHDAKMRSSPHA